jgi:hypothetical protein
MAESTSKKKNYKQGVVLITILVLPSLFYLLLTTGKHNFIYLPNIVYNQGEYTIDKTGKEYPAEKDVQIKWNSISGVDLKTGKPTALSQLPKKIYLVQFMDNDSIAAKDLALLRMINHQLGERLVPFEELQFLTLWKEKWNGSDISKIGNSINADYKSWNHIALNTNDFLTIKKQFFALPILDNDINLPSNQFVFILDKENKVRTGWDKQDRVFFGYNAGKEYVNKLLLEDAKLLLAEYLKSLKSRDAQNK